MYIENLCCVAKGLQKAAEKISPVVWVYTAGEDEEAVDIFNQNFFYDVVEKLRTDDLLLIYTPLESTKIYWAKIIKIHNNITLEAISTGGGAGGDVISVNGKNGVVVLSATDILNQAQLDSVNSGITAEKVAEYDHNLEEFEQLSGEVATLEAEQQTIKSDLGDLGDQVIENNNAIATKNNIFQLDVFPDLNTPNVPNPFQYVGETIGSAIKGHIYEKVETDFTQWERNDNQTYVVTMGGALVGDDVYQADSKTMIGTITEISDSAMTYTDTDGQSISTTYHSVFHTSGFEEVYTFGDDIDLSDYAKKTEVYTRDNADALFIKNTEKGQANGVATLNSSGVIPNEQINISSLNVKGTWDASTNTPALTNGVGESGDFYITSVAGAVDFGAGEIAFAVGDWALYTDSGVWEKSVNASAVQSVNGKTGLVNVLDTDVLNEDQLKAVNSGIDEVKVAQIETNTTDIAETKTSLETLQTTIENLNIPTATSQLTNDSGYQTSEQVSATVTSEVSKIVADAPEDFNTLKEMSDWITEHQDDASAMNSAILENKRTLERLNIKQFNDPGSNTSLKYITITGLSAFGGIELNSAYAGKYMFSTPKSTPIYFGSGQYRGYTLNGYAWNDDGSILYLRVTGFKPFSISVLGSVSSGTINTQVSISDMTNTAPEGITFVGSLQQNAVIDDKEASTTSTYSSSKIEEGVMSMFGRRKMTVFYNSGSSDKWYKVCSATTNGLAVNFKLTSSRVDNTSMVEYFSVLFRDNKYKYTHKLIFSSLTVYGDNVSKFYSPYFVADANNDIWIHVPSYTKSIIEADCGTVTIDGTEGTPVADYVYESFTGRDTKITNIAFINANYAESTSGGHGSTYTIVNGICYVNLDMRMKANNQILFILPKPVQTVVNVLMPVFMHNLTEGAEAVNNGVLILRSNGEVSTVGALTNESRYMLNFSYPVAK